MDEFASPIAENESANEQDLREAADLHAEANTLRREAAESVASARLASFEQAIDLERAADRYEYRVAQREGSLRYELEPEFTLARTQAEHLERLIVEIDATMTALDERSAVQSSEVNATRELMDGLRAEIDATLEALHESVERDLAPIYVQADATLDSAESQARRAASRGGRNDKSAAMLAVARALALKGQLQTTRARGLDAGAALLAMRLEAEERLGAAPGGSARYDGLMSQREASIAAAKEAFEGAKEALSGVSGDQAAEFSQSLDGALAGARR